MLPDFFLLQKNYFLVLACSRLSNNDVLFDLGVMAFVAHFAHDYLIIGNLFSFYTMQAIERKLIKVEKP